MKVLVVEDNPTLAEQICGLLADMGYEAVEARDERTAESILAESGSSYAIAVVDMKLPAKSKDLSVGEAGLRVIRFLAQQYPAVLSIVHTGHEEFSNAMKCIDEGASFYLVKASEFGLLRKTVKRAAEMWREREKLKRAESAVSRIYSSLPILVGKLDAVDALSGDIRGFCERIRDEFQDLAGRPDV